MLAAAGFFFLRNGTDADPAPHPAAATADGAGAAPAGGASELAKSTLASAPAPALASDTVQRTAAPTVGDGKANDAVEVRGRLIDAQGAPRSGVDLALRTWPGFDGLDFDVLPPPLDRERDSKDQPKYTTRSDGTFRIPLAKDRTGSLELVTDALVFAGSEPIVAGKKGDQDLGDVTVLREGRVSGVVQDQRGQPVAGVKVAVTIGALGFGTSSSATTKADGVFSLGMLRPGHWSLRTASGKFLPTIAEIEVASEEQRTGVVLVVKPGNAIAGQVVDDRGVGVANMKVGSKRKEVKGAVDIERFSADEATNTDANGYFTLSGLAEEAASVRAFGPGHSSATAADVPIGTGNLVLRVERLGVVEGVLVGADGKPIAGSRVTAQGAGGPGEGLMVSDDFVLDGPPGRYDPATTAADGTFRLDSVKPGSVTIAARGKTHRPARQAGVNVLPAQVTKGVRLVADLGATARVKVTDDAGKPVAGATVRAERVQAQAGDGGSRFFARARAVEDHGNAGAVMLPGDGRLGSATTDAEGLAAIAGLPAGDLSFSATHGEFAPAEAVRVSMPKAGTVDAALTLRKPGQAEILVFGVDGTPQSGVDLQVKAEGGEAKRATSGEGGLALVTSLAPGEYTAAVSRSPAAGRFGDAMVWSANGDDVVASTTQKFKVTAGETVRVELRRPLLTKVYGVVTGADGPAAGCVVELTQDGPGGGIPGFGGHNATAGADGAFAFDDVEPGHYVLEFGKRDQVVKARHELDVPANTPELRQDLALRTGKLRVQVVAQGSGEAVEKAEVELVRADASASEGSPRPRQQRVVMVSMVMTNNGNDGGESTQMTVGAQRAHTDEDGVAEIDDVPVGDYTVRIKHRKHAPFELKGKAVAERQLTDCGRVELAGAGYIRGKIVASDGKPVGMAMVTSRPVDSQQWSEPVMAQGGNFRLQGLAAGRYKVRAQAVGPTAGGYSPEIDVEVKSGETATADLQLPPQ